MHHVYMQPESTQILAKNKSKKKTFIKEPQSSVTKNTRTLTIDQFKKLPRICD